MIIDKLYKWKVIIIIIGGGDDDDCSLLWPVPGATLLGTLYKKCLF